MEKQIAEKLVALLGGSSQITAVVGDRIAPLYLDEGVEPPFILYRINDVSGESKDGLERYNVFVVLVFQQKSYTECLDLKNVVKAVLKETEFEFRESDIGFDEETFNVICTMRFETYGE